MKKVISFLIASVLVFSAVIPVSAAKAESRLDSVLSNTAFAVSVSKEIAKGESLRLTGKMSEKTDFSFAYNKVLFCEDGRFVLFFENEAELYDAKTALSLNPDILWYEEDSEIFAESSLEEVFTQSEAAESDEDALSYAVKAIGAREYAATVNTTRETTVAVIDSGAADIDFIKDRLVPGYDFADADSDTTNDTHPQSHGTFLCSLIVDTTRGANVKIMPVRVLSSTSGSLINAVNGIYYAADNGADVINISLAGRFTDCTSLEEAVNYAVRKGACVAVCAGNAKTDTATICPAHIASAITVSATDSNNKFASSFSDYGNEVDIAAPGVKINGYNAKGELKTLSGTSMSTAFVSACAALLKLREPFLSGEELKSVLCENAVDLGDEGRDTLYGCGLLSLLMLSKEKNMQKIPTVTLKSDKKTLRLNETASLSAVSSEELPEGMNLIFTSSDEEILKVDSNGSVTAKKGGTAKIRASVVNENGKALTDVNGNTAQAEITLTVKLTKHEKIFAFVSDLIISVIKNLGSLIGVQPSFVIE